MNTETIRDVFNSYPLAVRKDYGGFVVVAFQCGSEWSGRAWRVTDWKPFMVCSGCSDREQVFSFYRQKIDTLKLIASTVP